MTDAEKFRLVAEWLEPMPTLPPYHILMDSKVVSKLRAWKWDYPEGSWQPADFLHDESANALIVDKMLLLHWVMTFIADERGVRLYMERSLEPNWFTGPTVRMSAIVDAAIQLIAAEKRKA